MTELTYQHFFGGMVGGMFGTFISHPIDTMRIRLQTDKQIITNVQCLKNIPPSNQVSHIMRDLYKGVKAPIIGIGLEKTIVFGTYHNIYEYHLFGNEVGNQIFAGSMAGLLSTLVVSPIEKIKILYQNNQVNSLKNCFSKIKDFRDTSILSLAMMICLLMRQVIRKTPKL